MDIKELEGKTLICIEGMEKDSYNITFRTDDNKEYKMYNYEAECGNDCCIWVEDVCGDIDDLLNTPLLSVYEDSNEKTGGEYNTIEGWTFYNFRTIKGSLTLRWGGESNGYYSVMVDFEEKGGDTWD